MQFVKNGPEIPEPLLQAHEEGRVVFFCGAGISYPAGLPGFKELVENLYDALAEERRPLEEDAFKQARYDTVIGLLESRVLDGRNEVRRHLLDALKPNLTLQTHKALLTLSRNRKPLFTLSRNYKYCYRLVTTNFDRLFFEAAIDCQKRAQVSSTFQVPSTFQAPFLPIPKNRWNGLVYLHGLLSEKPSEDDLNQLVLSSGDFGLAYLTERWAARFVAELFREYTVCFVGYSIDDPVLRYMMDAWAADRLMGETPKTVYAFANVSKGKEDATKNEWESKNVTPILYHECEKHFYLHDTLREWADIYRDGVRGKEAIVTRYAGTPPTESTAQDDFVGRMLWALSDSTGLPAKHFVEFNPVPPLAWLDTLTKERFDGLMALVVSDSNAVSSWDDVMYRIACWLARHLDNPKLLLWIVSYGGILHPKFRWILLNKMKERHKNGLALPDSMRCLWRVLFAGRIQCQRNRNEGWAFFSQWKEYLARDGWSPSLAWSFRKALAPYVQISEPFRFPSDGEENTGVAAGEKATGEKSRVSDLVQWEIKLASSDVHFAIESLSDNKLWKSALPKLLPDLTLLLKDALDLMRELEGAGDHHDVSDINQPSISPHSQNRTFNDWTALIDLLRDSWLAAVKEKPDVARDEARRWVEIPYPLFRRLAFFAAAQRPDVLLPNETIPWLLADDRRWLWNGAARREMFRLFVALAPIVTSEQSAVLQRAILQDPPRHIFRDDIEPKRLQNIIDRETWVLLAKYQAADGILIPEASTRLRLLSEQHPQWKLAPDDRDEFSFWMSSDDEWRIFRPTPKLRQDLEKWLREHPPSDDMDETDDWRERCADDFPRTTTALCNLARQGVWPVKRWSPALQEWARDKHLRRSWKYISPVLVAMPDEELKELAHPIAWWLQFLSKGFSGNEDVFFNLIHRILESQRKETDIFSGDAVSHAMNHTVGLVTDAALSWWNRQNLQDKQGLREEVAPIFTDICNPDSTGLRSGRIILASNVITLYRVDRAWTEIHLLPYFDWKNPEIARDMWQGFMRSPRIYRPLMEHLKTAFLETAQHYDELGDGSGEQYVVFLTYAALDSDDTFKLRDFKAAFAQFSPTALAQVAETLFRSLQGAGDQKSEYLHNRIGPFIKRIWPKTQQEKSPKILEYFAMLCAVAGEAFLEATKIFGVWLQPLHINNINFVIHLLEESGSCSDFPQESLDFLDCIVPETLGLYYGQLRECLDDIKYKQPDLEEDPRYERLDTLLRQRDQ